MAGLKHKGYKDGRAKELKKNRSEQLMKEKLAKAIFALWEWECFKVWESFLKGEWQNSEKIILGYGKHFECHYFSEISVIVYL